MTKIIAELGSTWQTGDGNGLSHLLNGITLAARCGVDIVKVQVFRARTLYSRERAPRNYDNVKKYELPIEWLPLAQDIAHHHRTQLWASVFDKDLARDVAPFVDGLKIASGDLTNVGLFLSVARLAADCKLDFCFSAGAATEPEIVQAIRWYHDEVPDSIATLMHCVSAYPAEESWMNLRAALAPLRYCGKDPVTGQRYIELGLSDHTRTDAATAGMLAVAAGFECIEKHVSCQNDIRTPDHVVAMPMDHFRTWVERVRYADIVMGSGVKTIHPAEANERLWARRGSDGLRPVVGTKEVPDNE